MGKIMCSIKGIISMVILCAVFTQTGYPMKKKKAPQSKKVVGTVQAGEWGYNQPNAANVFLKQAPEMFKTGMDAVDKTLSDNDLVLLARALNGIAIHKANSTINVNTNRAGEQINKQFPAFFQKMRKIVNTSTPSTNLTDLGNLQEAVIKFVSTFVPVTTDGAAGFQAPNLANEYTSTMQKFEQARQTIQLALNSGSGTTGGSTGGAPTIDTAALTEKIRLLEAQLADEKEKFEIEKEQLEDEIKHEKTKGQKRINALQKLATLLRKEKDLNKNMTQYFQNELKEIQKRLNNTTDPAELTKLNNLNKALQKKLAELARSENDLKEELKKLKAAEKKPLMKDILNPPKLKKADTKTGPTIDNIIVWLNQITAQNTFTKKDPDKIEINTGLDALTRKTHITDINKDDLLNTVIQNRATIANTKDLIQAIKDVNGAPVATIDTLIGELNTKTNNKGLFINGFTQNTISLLPTPIGNLNTIITPTIALELIKLINETYKDVVVDNRAQLLKAITDVNAGGGGAGGGGETAEEKQLRLLNELLSKLNADDRVDTFVAQGTDEIIINNINKAKITKVNENALINLVRAAQLAGVIKNGATLEAEILKVNEVTLNTLLGELNGLANDAFEIKNNKLKLNDTSNINDTNKDDLLNSITNFSTSNPTLLPNDDAKKLRKRINDALTVG